MEIFKLILTIFKETIAIYEAAVASDDPDYDAELQALLNAERKITDALAKKKFGDSKP